jgi:hypothetical protein
MGTLLEKPKFIWYKKWWIWLIILAIVGNAMEKIEKGQGKDAASNFFSVFMLIMAIIIFCIIKKEKSLKREIADKTLIKNRQDRENKEKLRQEKIIQKLAKVDALTKKIEKVKAIEVPKTNEVKEFILENEKVIVEKGGDEKLFQFLKVDSFIQDFKKGIENDIHSVVDNYFESDIKNTIEEYENENNSLQRSIDHFKDISTEIDGGEGNSLNAKIERLFKIGNNLKPAIEKEIATLNFYKSISIAMITFYLNDNKILFFELYEAFDKLGAFDNSWQKKVASKLDSIDVRLANLNNQMEQLSAEFTRIADNSDRIVDELRTGFEKLHSQINGTNLLLGITAYQTYRINKNTKGTNS